MTELKFEAKFEERIESFAKAHNRTLQSVVHDAIEEYVDRAERREQFNRDTLESWADYKATGLHIKDEELDEWLTKLEAGENPPPPECHT